MTDGLDAVDEQLIARLTGKAREGGMALTGEGGLLAQLTKRLVESALDGELTDHLGYDKHDLTVWVPRTVSRPLSRVFGGHRPRPTSHSRSAASQHDLPLWPYDSARRATDLVAQHEELHVLGRRYAAEKRQPAQYPTKDQVEQA